MLTYFSMPYEGEIFYSIISRYRYYSGSVSYAKMMMDLFGYESQVIAIELPNGLEHLSNVINNNKITSDYFIKNHTLLPIFKPFLSSRKSDEIVDIMRARGSKSLYFKLGLISGKIQRNTSLFYCPLCVKDTLNKYNEAFFHRIHQFQGVLVCPHHGCLTKEYPVNLKSITRNELIRLENNFIDLSVEYEQNMVMNSMLKKISDAALYLLNAKISDHNIDSVLKKYQNILTNMRLLQLNGKVIQIKLQSQFKEFYGEEILDRLNINFIEEDPSNWISTITVQDKVMVHPLKHILFIIFLYGDIKNFFRHEIERIGPLGNNGPWPCLNPVCVNYHKDVINNCKMKYDDRSRRPIGIFECSCGFKYSKISPINDSNKYKVGNIKDFGHIWKETLSELILEKKYTLNELSTKMSCYSKTIIKHANNLGLLELIDTKANLRIYKHNNKIENLNHTQIRDLYRRDIEKYVIENKDDTRMAVRRKQIKQYDWLYKFDKDWLYKNVSAKDKQIKKRTGFNKIDWERRDIDTVKLIQSMYKELLELKVPKRITKCNILKNLGRIGVLKTCYDKLPKTNDYLDEIGETMKQFNIRKIDEACKELYRSQENLNKWEVIRVARVHSNYNDSYILERIKENIEMH